LSFVFLLQLKTLCSKENQPAFYHAYEYVRGQKLGVIRLNPVVSERIAKDGLRATLHPRHLPMLIKPKPWLNHDQGGYLYNQCEYTCQPLSTAR
jgi:DNA-directed RNA polymerase